MALEAQTELAPELQKISKSVLTPEATEFVAVLHRKFNGTRKQLLSDRAARQKRLDLGEKPDFLAETANIRSENWSVGPCPADLQDRRVEITGPAEPKMVINALNSGARVFMADFEDSLSPTWENVLVGQDCLMRAVRGTLRLETAGKTYCLKDTRATLKVRPRGWHLEEMHFRVDGEPVSASLFDFGLFFFHNAKELIARRSGPYFYLPKMESHREARLWNDVFIAAQEALGIPQGTIRATVLIETILAAFEMDEILYELRTHASGLNAGRWDYIFSFIKKFKNFPEMALPDRSQVTMTVPFMKAYAGLLVRTCHRRGAHAMGGMAAFIPNRKDAEITRHALAKVREDKEREATSGFDGTWVAHPDLVPVATEIFDRVLGAKPNQVMKTGSESSQNTREVKAQELLNPEIPGSTISEAGIRLNINVALQYLERWLAGVGAAAIHNLMEDAATAEISRAQIWQWIQRGSKITDGRPVTSDLYKRILKEELIELGWQPGRMTAGDALSERRKIQAVELLDSLILSSEFTDFLTIPAYQALVGAERSSKL